MNKVPFIKKVHLYIIAHKAISAVIAVALIWGGYSAIKVFSGGTTAVQYAIAAVEKGTIVATVSATGQVSASNQVDLQGKASGNLISLNVNVGQEVKAGQLIGQIDPRDANISLQNAKIALAKLTQSADQSTLLQSENALETSRESYSDAQVNLVKYYGDVLNEVAGTFVDTPGILDGLNSMYYTSNGVLSDNQTLLLPGNIKISRTTAGAEYDVSRKAYNDLLPIYTSTNRSSSTSTIESLLASTYDMVVKTAEALKDSKNTLDYIKSNQLQQSSGAVTTAESNLNSWITETNSHLSNLQSLQSEIVSAKASILSSARDIQQKQAALEKLKAGADPLDVQSQQLSVQQQENNYSNYFIRAPFDGIIAKLDVKKSDSISNGTVVGTIISKNQIAEMSLNEVDASKVAVGQKATITFDAIEGLSITGHVAEIDLLGTVTQGVVTYDIKIAFDTQDERVKPGMTANASIQTAVKGDVIVVPNSAVKTSGGVSFVQVVPAGTAVTIGGETVSLSVVPNQQQVTVGISDDLNTEIVSGLNEGDKIVSKMSSKTTTSASASQAPSLFGGGSRSGTGRTVTP